MKRVLVTAALTALALSGCQLLREKLGMPTSERPAVSVVNGQIVVDPEPLTFRPHQRNVTIIWRVQDPFQFDRDRGITIDGEVAPGRPPDPRQTEIINCRPGANGKQFMCLNKNAVPGKTYKYTVRLIGPNGSRFERDPFIVNGL